jgi:hypothetical protein
MDEQNEQVNSPGEHAAGEVTEPPFYRQIYLAAVSSGEP